MYAIVFVQDTCSLVIHNFCGVCVLHIIDVVIRKWKSEIEVLCMQTTLAGAVSTDSSTAKQQTISIRPVRVRDAWGGDYLP